MQQLSKHGLGASEIAAVAGLNPHASPWDVWLTKTGQSTFSGNELTEWGHRLEPAIRLRYCDETGAVVVVPGGSMFHRVHAWVRATPDGMVWDGATPERIEELRSATPVALRDATASRLFQAKNVNEWEARMAGWADACPDHVQLQEQWEMLVTGAPEADVCALIGGNTWVMHRVFFDARIANDLLEIGAAFMRDLAQGIQPKVDGSDACSRHLRAQLRKRDAIVEVVADADLESAVQTWHDAHVEIARAAARKEAARNTVMAAIAAAGATRLVTRVGHINVKAGSTRQNTDWEHVARLVASATGMDRNEFAKIVDDATKRTTTEPTISAPTTWSKEDR